jgi:hypothetical protein
MLRYQGGIRAEDLRSLCSATILSGWIVGVGGSCRQVRVGWMVVGWRLDVGGAVSVEDISDGSCDRSDPSAECRGSNNLGRTRSTIITIHGSRSSSRFFWIYPGTYRIYTYM